ncbi:MAG: hypothetical protein H0V09_10610 [Gemmatimonadetes bacterium]|nr:hypothetical protein [Gemmatimonadota bacterium]
MRTLNALLLAFGLSMVATVACDSDSDVEDAAEDVEDAADDAEDAVD